METGAAPTQDPPALRDPLAISICVLCMVVNVLIAAALVGLAIVELAPTPLESPVIASSPLLAVASTLLAAFVLGMLFGLRSVARARRA